MNNDNKKKQMKCEICGEELDNGVCPKCGWVHIVFPSIATDTITAFNNKRREVASRLIQESKDAKQTIDQLKRQLDEAKNARKESAQGESRETTIPASQISTQGQSDSKEVSRLTEETNRLNEQVRQLSEVIANLRKENGELSYAINTGTQFIITENKGKYTLYDPSRKVRRANNTLIGMSGIELYNGYTFRFGDIAFTVNVSEINIDDIMFNN